MSSISAKRLAKKEKISIPLRFYPCLLIGRLAVDNTWRHLDVGTYLADWSTGLALELSEEVGCRYVILETKESKVEFYNKCGFQRGAALAGDNLIWMYKKIAIEH
jgi:GNAT superfamily N-acetyltransferase